LKVVLGVIGILLFVGIFVFFFYIHQRKRSKEWQAIAETLNLRYYHKNKAFWEDIKKFNLISYAPYVWNIMEGIYQTNQISIFDYQYETATSSSLRNIYQQTVVLLQNDDLTLSHFILQPESLSDKIDSKFFGLQDVDIDLHPNFSSNYLLHGSEENKIRSIFNEKILSFFENHDGLFVEGKDNQLLIYKKNVLISNEEGIKALMEEGVSILNLFRES